MSRILLASVIWHLISGCNAAYAGAWTQPPGHGQIIYSSSAYATESYFDNRGRRQSQPLYRKLEFNPYIEYGLFDGVTIGASLSYQYADQDVLFGRFWHRGPGDSEFFIRKRLWQQDGFVVSTEPMVKLPSPTSPAVYPRLGSSTPDAGLGFLFGYGFGSGDLHHFADIDIGYRYRFGAPQDQIRLAGTLGYSLTPNWMAMPQVFITRRRGTMQMPMFTLSPADDYDLVKLQLSAVYKFNEKISLQCGMFSHVAGKNTGGGGGLTVSLWQSF